MRRSNWRCRHEADQRRPSMPCPLVWTFFLLMYLLEIVRRRNYRLRTAFRNISLWGRMKDKEAWSLGDWVDVYSNKPGHS